MRAFAIGHSIRSSTDGLHVELSSYVQEQQTGKFRAEDSALLKEEPTIMKNRIPGLATLDDDREAEEQPLLDATGLSASRLAAVIENRAKEIGLAVFDGAEATLHLTQFAGDSSAEPHCHRIRPDNHI